MTPRRRPGRGLAFALASAVLVIGLALTALVANAQRGTAADADESRLARMARGRADALAEVVHHDILLLRAAAAFQSTNRDDAAFVEFVEQLDLEAIAGLSSISFIDRSRSVGVSAPADDQADVLVGLMDESAERGLPIISEPFVREQDRALPLDDQPMSVALYVPVYEAGADVTTTAARRAALIGWTATAVRVPELLDALRLGSAEVRVDVRDSDLPQLSLAASRAGAPEIDAPTATATAFVAGERWEVEVTELPAFLHANDSSRAVAFAGILASVAVASLVLDTILRRRRLASAIEEAREDAAVSQHRFQAAFENAPVGVVVTDLDGRILEANPAFVRMLGDPEVVPTSIQHTALPEDLAQVDDNVGRFRRGEIDNLVSERRFVRADGSTVWARITSARLDGDRGLVGMVQDVTAERAAAEAAEELRSRRARFEALVRNSSDLITVLGPDLKVLYASPAVAALVGISPEEAVGTDALEAVHPRDREAVRDAFVAVIAGPGIHDPIRYRMVSTDGSMRVVEATTTNLLDDPDVRGIVANCRDVTAQEEAAEVLRQRAYHDPLTGLATRDVLVDRLGRALTTASGSGGTAALLFVDLDRFKLVNDRFGHGAGDALLIAVSKVIVEAVRPGDLVARHGGDEFVVLLEAVRGVREARAVAERVRLALRRPVVVEDGIVIEPGGSVGVALSTKTSTPESLLRDADAALYRAKDAGRDRVEVFDDELRKRAMRRLDTELVLRQALEDDAVALRFEPVADLQEGGIVGAEARVRLSLPSGELLPFTELLPIAQEVGLASDLASEALSAACRAVAAWSAGTGRPRWVGIDVSAGEVTHPSFLERLAGLLDATGVEAGSLRLELPVEVVTSGTALTRRAIAAARALGVGVVLDGVGAELRALAALGNFGVDGLKLDLGALPDLIGDPVAAAVASSVAEVAGAAGLPVVVVGANRLDQLDSVRSLGFRFVQGTAVAPELAEGALVELFA